MRWYLIIDEIGRHVQDAEINEDNYICDVESSDKDAKLITAAPDLLEACKHVIKEAKNVKGKMFSILPVLNAIAKAEQK